MMENDITTMHAGCFRTRTAPDQKIFGQNPTFRRSNRFPHPEGIGDGSLRPTTGGTHD